MPTAAVAFSNSATHGLSQSGQCFSAPTIRPPTQSMGFSMITSPPLCHTAAVSSRPRRVSSFPFASVARSRGLRPGRPSGCSRSRSGRGPLSSLPPRKRATQYVSHGEPDSTML